MPSMSADCYVLRRLVAAIQTYRALVAMSLTCSTRGYVSGTVRMEQTVVMPAVNSVGKQLKNAHFGV